MRDIQMLWVFIVIVRPIIYFALLVMPLITWAACGVEQLGSKPFEEIGKSVVSCLSGNFEVSQIDNETGQEIKSGLISLMGKSPFLTQMKYSWGNSVSGYLAIGVDTQKEQFFSINGNDYIATLNYFHLDEQSSTLISEPGSDSSVIIELISANEYILTQKTESGFVIKQIYKRVENENP